MIEWNLAFQIEDTEADTRYQSIVAALMADPHVKDVEVSNSLAQPESRGLVVRFHEGKTTTLDPMLQHLERVYRVVVVPKPSRLRLLREDDDL